MSFFVWVDSNSMAVLLSKCIAACHSKAGAHSFPEDKKC